MLQVGYRWARPLWLLPLAILLAAGAADALASQRGSGAALWQDMAPGRLPGKAQIATSHRRTLRLDEDRLLSLLATPPREGAKGIEVSLPSPGGGFARYRLVEAPVMAAELAARFPAFRTFRGRGVDDPAATIRADWTHHGFHASVLSPTASFFIDPYQPGDTRHYISYDRLAQVVPLSRRLPDKVLPGVAGYALESSPSPEALETARTSVGSEIRVYRTAVAATGEYTAFHGGTVVDGMAAIVTAINRVNQVLEAELAMRLELVANNDLVVYTDAATDPYTNDNLIAMLGENTANLNAVIGNANFDLGHVFGTQGGGVVGGAVCGPGKSSGATGIPSPIGDPFYVDYVSHEVGHQLYGNHTFDNCEGSQGPAPYEPGSAATIMGYAGICGADNLQPNSDPHFHSYNIFDEIIPGTQGGCGMLDPTGNTPPVVNAGPGGHTIPASTPFELTGSASDADDDPLTYLWDEVDYGGNTSPDDPTSPPFFRGWPATTDPSRVFPRLSDLVNNTTAIGEVLPSVDTILRFRFVVRDNVGGVTYDSLSLNVDSASGPFLVLGPNTAETWSNYTTEMVAWDVAGTDAAPVSCGLVDILLSADGGFTYPITLAAGEANDGTAAVTVPNVPTTTARVKVRCSDNIFFDISDTDFTIQGEPGFRLSTPFPSETACAGGAAVFPLTVESILGFTDPVTLSTQGSTGGTPGFSVNPVTPVGSSDLTITGLTGGTYPFSVEGQDGGTVESVDLTLQVEPGPPAAPGSPVPPDAAVGVLVPPTLSWAAIAGATSYDVEIATDAAFTAIVDSASVSTNSYQPAVSLDGLTLYHWRVRGVSVCGAGSYATFQFTTEDTSLCGSGFAIPDTGGTASQTIDIQDSSLVWGLELQLLVDHPWVQDLQVTLTHVASGTEVLLLDRPSMTAGCSGEDLDLVFDDAASMPVDSACTASVPTLAGNVLPEEPLGAFFGLPLAGSWRLEVWDTFPVNAGSVKRWCLIPALGPDGPGETSGPAQTLMTVAHGSGNQMVVTFDPGCDATSNNLYYGPLDQVASYGWSGSRCNIGTGPTWPFFATVEDSVFFVVVGTKDGVESSYGRSSAGVERPPFAGACSEVYSLANSCE